MSRKKLTIVIEFKSLYDLFTIFKSINRSVRLGAQHKVNKSNTFKYWFTFEYIPDEDGPKIDLKKNFYTIKSRV